MPVQHNFLKAKFLKIFLAWFDFYFQKMELLVKIQIYAI